MFLALRSILRESGLRLRRLRTAVRAWPGYVKDRRRFRSEGLRRDFAWGRELPILTEKAEASGGYGAYLIQDLAVARWVHQAEPERHVDVGSRIDGFVTHVASFRDIEVIDLRESPGVIEGVTFHRHDMMAELPATWQGTIPSLSCLHTIEHFGLGRYGDRIDPDGHEKGLRQLKRMVAPGGVLYLSTPVGPQRVEFNAHRVFSVRSLLEWFQDGWRIERFAVITDEGDLLDDLAIDDDRVASDFGCLHGVGIVAARRADRTSGSSHVC